jgi:hypothetical protein
MLVRKHPRVNATPGPLLVAAGWIALAATSSCGQAGVVASTPARAGQEIRNLAMIQERWDASDLVCTGKASAPVRTGRTRMLEGSDRDQLSSEVQLETCFKGERPIEPDVRVLGYDNVALKDVTTGYVYGGPPTGFVTEGRNLLFLRPTPNSGEFEVTVPIYQTAIHLADVRPDGLPGKDQWRLALTREFEAAQVQFDDTDLSYTGYLIDLLGVQPGVAELSRFSREAPLAVQRDVAVALLSHGRPDAEPVVLALLLDASASPWKRQNAAAALGAYGTAAVAGPLRQIASDPPATEDLRTLQSTARDALDRLEHRLHANQGLVVPTQP